MENQTRTAPIRTRLDRAAAQVRRFAVPAVLLAPLLLVAVAASGSGVGPAAAAGRDDPVSDAGAAPADGTLGEGVTGRVVDAKGAPVAGALVVPASAGGAPRAIPDMAVLTDADGRFWWPLGPGRYRMDAVMDGRVAGSAPAVVGAGRASEVRIVIGTGR